MLCRPSCSVQLGKVSARAELRKKTPSPGSFWGLLLQRCPSASPELCSLCCCCDRPALPRRAATTTEQRQLTATIINNDNKRRERLQGPSGEFAHQTARLLSLQICSSCPELRESSQALRAGLCLQLLLSPAEEGDNCDATGAQGHWHTRAVPPELDTESRRHQVPLGGLLQPLFWAAMGGRNACSIFNV